MGHVLSFTRAQIYTVIALEAGISQLDLRGSSSIFPMRKGLALVKHIIAKKSYENGNSTFPILQIHRWQLGYCSTRKVKGHQCWW